MAYKGEPYPQRGASFPHRPRFDRGVLIGPGKKTASINLFPVDNYLFGVASVSKDGYGSPVAFPGPMGSFDE
jgi:hypothetical protein